jgi:hypothetical protein
LVLTSFGALSTLLGGCSDPRELAKWTKATTAIVPQAQAQTAAPPQAPVAVAVPVYAPAPAQAAPGSLAEKPLDTRTPPPAAQPPQEVPAPVVANKNRKVRTVSDEHLPSWVPARGRLTVVESSDLAENLGLVPAGTTKKTDERISVAEKLAEENEARAGTARPSDPIVRGVNWNFSTARSRPRR